MSAGRRVSSQFYWGQGFHCIMRISDPTLIGALAALGVEHEPGVPMSEKTSLGIGGTSNLLLILKHDAVPELVRLLKQHAVPYRFLGGGSNVLLPDGELPWVILQLERQNPEVRIEGNSVLVDCAADLGRTVTTCAKADLGAMEGLIGVPGTIAGPLLSNPTPSAPQLEIFLR